MNCNEFAKQNERVKYIEKLVEFSTYWDFHNRKSVDRNRLNLIKIFIDYQENHTLQDCISKVGKYSLINEKELLIIAAYLYYQSFSGDRLLNKEEVEYAQMVIHTNKGVLGHIIGNDIVVRMNSEEIQTLYSCLQQWEKIELDTVKTLMYESETDYFFIFCALAIRRFHPFSETIQKIWEGREFTLYSKCFDGEDKKRVFEERYKIFSEAFNIPPDEQAVEWLKYNMSERFKEYSTIEAVSEHLTTNERDAIQKYSTDVAVSYSSEIASAFSENMQDTLEKVDFETTGIFMCDFELKRKDKSDLDEIVQGLLLISVMQELYSKGKIMIGKSDYKNIMLNIEKLSKKSVTLNPDIIIGFKRWFGFEETKRFEKYIEPMTKLENGRLTGADYFLESSRLTIKNYSIKVQLREYGRQEILDTYEKVKNQETGLYSYVITNRLSADFTEDELVNYMQNQGYIISISGSFDLGMSEDEYVGFGFEFN